VTALASAQRPWTATIACAEEKWRRKKDKGGGGGAGKGKIAVWGAVESCVDEDGGGESRLQALGARSETSQSDEEDAVAGILVSSSPTPIISPPPAPSTGKRATTLLGSAMAMDGINLAASIADLLILAKNVIEYIRDVSEATEQKQLLLQEIIATRELLAKLDRYSTESKWEETMYALNKRQGPLDQLGGLFKRMEATLKPPSGKVAKSAKALVWPFAKGEVTLFLTRLERIKALLNIALQNEHLFLLIPPISNGRVLAEAIKAGVDSLADMLQGKPPLRDQKDS